MKHVKEVIKRIIPAIAVCVIMLNQDLKGQALSFEMVQDHEVTFVFNTIEKYQNGLVAMNAITLRIIAEDVNWDLYVGAETLDPGLWDVIGVYGTVGQEPGIELLEARFRNSASTSLVEGFFELTDITTPTYIIGSPGIDVPVACPGQGTNTPGSYLSEPQCYQFNVDLRIVPGFDYRPGLYRLLLNFVISEDL